MPDVRLSFASVITDDIVSLSEFYGTVFGLDEVIELRSDHFRGLHLGETILGFSAPAAYSLLNLKPAENPSGTDHFLTFEVADDGAVDALTERAVTAGAQCIKPPNRTYYGAWQAVLIDPAGNAFRINHLTIA
ncbi:VOC family protein [Mycobacterium sp. NPDC003449]